MAIQIGTVDGLVNISFDTILCFTKGIEEFEKQGGPAYANSEGISYGTAFQRFIEPVYTDRTKPYVLSSIKQPVRTRSGEEQSPARVTFCKKMGLLKVDESSSIFSITPLGKAVLEKDININEYAFILLSKMGVFKDGVYIDNLLCVISSYFQFHATISQEDIGAFVKKKYGDTNIVKTRFDIIINSLVLTGLITKVIKDVYALSGIGQAEVLSDFYNHSNLINKAKIDTSNEYADYIGNMENGGIFGVLSKENASIYLKFFPNLKRYVRDIIISNPIPSIPKTSLLEIQESIHPFITAIKSKPFLLLAGISGTGKSRIVRELAFMTCPKELQDEDGTTPGNYCMIEVKPNWHDSTELLGYYSSFNGGGYRFTKFDRFVVKAWLNPDVPFFVCLDEMNLAPVEQYFAEFLSVLETRSRDKEGNVVSGALVDKQYFKDDTKMKEALGLDGADDWTIKVRSDLVNKGLTLPPNLIVIGTVNMDDTTYQFSRKVIDRAMTIEMNGGELSQMFGNSNSLKYRSDEDVVKLGLFKAPYINADEVIERYQSQAQIIKEKLPEKLEAVNTALNDTPFQVSYRVLNELVIYLGALMDEATAKGEAIDDDALPTLINQAMDQITLMKILPRIEGDEDMFRRSGGANVLKTLQSLFSEDSDSYRKLEEMADRLDRTGFTRFWP